MEEHVRKLWKNRTAPWDEETVGFYSTITIPTEEMPTYNQWIEGNQSIEIRRECSIVNDANETIRRVVYNPRSNIHGASLLLRNVSRTKRTPPNKGEQSSVNSNELFNFSSLFYVYLFLSFIRIGSIGCYHRGNSFICDVDEPSYH